MLTVLLFCVFNKYNSIQTLVYHRAAKIYRRNCCIRKTLVTFTVVTVLTISLIFLGVRFAMSLSKATGFETVINNTLLAGDGGAVVKSQGPVSMVTASIFDKTNTTKDTLKVQERERTLFIVPERSRVGKKVLIRHSAVVSPSRLDIGKLGDVNLDRWRYHFHRNRHQVSGNKGIPPFVTRENSSMRISHGTDQREKDVSDSKVTYLVNHRYKL